MKSDEQKAYAEGYEKALDDVQRAMYHQCFEVDNDPNMQKWESGCWLRYKLFEQVMGTLEH